MCLYASCVAHNAPFKASRPPSSHMTVLLNFNIRVCMHTLTDVVPSAANASSYTVEERKHKVCVCLCVYACKQLRVLLTSVQIMCIYVSMDK